MYDCIGQGACGTVWSAHDSHYVVKREESGPEGSAQNDFTMHQKALKVEAATVPGDLTYVSKTDNWWTDHLPRFPEGYEPCEALISERIPSFPREVRQRIDARLLSENLTADRSCLVRQYLGYRHVHELSSDADTVGPGDVPLYADQMEELGMDTTLYATKMAEALAGLYWKTGVDADQVKFILAPPRTPRNQSQSAFTSEALGDHSLWILGFDRCKTISMDGDGMVQAVAAFLQNKPYCPRPRSEHESDRALWKTFRDHFLATSKAMVHVSESGLPVLWVHLVEGSTQGRLTADYPLDRRRGHQPEGEGCGSLDGVVRSGRSIDIFGKWPFGDAFSCLYQRLTVLDEPRLVSGATFSHPPRR